MSTEFITDRRNYSEDGLDIKHYEDPLLEIKRWYKLAKEAGIKDYDATTLSTINEVGYPESRVVLIRQLSSSGLVFFTNYESDKSHQIEKNNKVSLNFYWKELDRQIRILGKAEKVSEIISNAYFASRPRGSQIGAWASFQSQELSNHQELVNRVEALDAKYKDEDVPRPAHWGGFIISPHQIEFWKGQPNRLHHRLLFSLKKGNWDYKLLNP